MIIVWHAAAIDYAPSGYGRKGSGLRRRRRRLPHAAWRLVECVRLMERGKSCPSMVDWTNVGEHAEALQTRAGFMRAFCVFVAALASMRRGFRSVLVAVPRLFAVRVHRLVRGYRAGGRASLHGRGCFRGSSRNNTAARVQHQAQGDEYGQEGAHCYNADLSLHELNAER
jgi:hypothetical protein